MLILWGSRLYGKTDSVKGLFHVATLFWHLWYLPLIPLGSHLVLRGPDNELYAVKLGLNAKSWLLVWARAALLVGGVYFLMAATFIAIEEANGGAGPGIWAMGVVGAAALLLWVWLTWGKWACGASYERAHALADAGGLNERARIMIDLTFGVISEQEAQAAFANLEAIEAREAQQPSAEMLAQNV
jgi:hypothetical protein